MPLVPAPDMLAAARAGGYALGYFESWDSYSLEAVLAAAEAENAPVIVGFGATMLADEWLDAGGIEFLGASGRALIEGCRIPVAFLLNETHTLAQAVRGVGAGFNFVMIDSHRWPVPQARDAVAKLVTAAHPAGVAVEAEFGSLPDYLDGAVDDSHAYMTDPGAAAEFVAATGVDCLAVAVGNVHLLTAYQAEIDLERLQAIQAAVDVPLAIHGGTGFPPDSVAAAISLGVAKFNVGTRLKRGFLDAVLERTRSWSGNESVHDLVGSHKQADFLAAGQSAITETVRSLLRLYGSSGQALRGSSQVQGHSGTGLYSVIPYSSPAASTSRLSAAVTAAWSRVVSRAMIRASSCRRHVLAAVTRSWPLAVSSRVTTPRCRGSVPRAACPAATSRSASLVTVEGSSPSVLAACPDGTGPRSASTASSRNCGSVTSSSRTSRLRSATPASIRVAVCSTLAVSGSSSGAPWSRVDGIQQAPLPCGFSQANLLQEPIFVSRKLLSDMRRWCDAAGQVQGPDHALFP